MDRAIAGAISPGFPAFAETAQNVYENASGSLGGYSMAVSSPATPASYTHAHTISGT